MFQATARAKAACRAACIALGLALALVACAGHRLQPTGAGAASRSLDGADLLDRRCTSCHDLEGLSAYADYWGEPEWRSMVETMIGYGAQLTPEETTVLSRYLAIRYGTGATGASDG